MRLSSFWPPGRTRDRLAAELYRRRHLHSPWLTRDAITLLSGLVTESDRVLEWGAGHSTAWLSRRAATVLSVEHDPVWYDRVRAELTRGGLDGDAVRLLSPATGHDPVHTAYVRAIDEIPGGEPTVCLVDGELRAACALEALARLPAGGLLIIDDAQLYLDHPTASPHSRCGRGALDGDWARVGRTLETWRLIWTSDGYSDTAFWIRP